MNDRLIGLIRKAREIVGLKVERMSLQPGSRMANTGGTRPAAGPGECASEEPSAGAPPSSPAGSEATAASVNSKTAETVAGSLGKVESALHGVQEIVEPLEERLTQLEETVNATARQVRQMHMNSRSLESMVSSISDPRHRAVLFGLLQLYNIIDQLPAGTPRSSPTREQEQESSQGAGDSQAGATVSDVPTTFATHELRMLRELVAELQGTVAQLEGSVKATAKQVSYLPSQVRMVGGKVDGLATAITEPRYRNVLLRLLGIYDLVDQLLRSLPSEQETATDSRRNYGVLRTQLRQILEGNGLTEIPTDGAFDPQIHQAVKRVSCDDPSRHNQVLEVLRPGFRTDQTVLRYAEVVVGYYEPPRAETVEEAGQPDKNKD